MTAPKMTVPPVEGDTPFERFENALKAVLAAPKDKIPRKATKKVPARKPAKK